MRPSPPRALDGLAFYALLPFRVARELRSFRPDAVLAQGAQEAALAVLGRSSPACRRASSRTSTATPPRPHGCTARRAAGRLRRSRMRSPASASGEATACGRSRRTRRGSCARRGSSRPPSSRRSWTSSPSPRREPRAAPERPRRALRRRARALQGGRRARRRVAARGAARARRDSPRRRSRDAARGAVASPRRSTRTDALDGGAARRRRSRARSTRPRCSCCRRARRASAASSSRRSAADAGWWRAVSAGSPTSSRTARPGCSSLPATRDALADALVRALSDRPSRSGSARQRTTPCSRGSRLPRSTRSRLRELVDDVAG